ncbi:MAG: hypothetical protein QM736_05965 [Vicinamibacterales bacterium]
MDIHPRAEAWRRDFRDWRHEHLMRMGYSGANYERPDLHGPSATSSMRR